MTSVGGRATIRDVAREAGVSVTTASRALNSKGELSDATRALVLSTAAELHYVPSDIARALVSGRTNTIGVLITDNASPVYADVLRGVEDIANANGYSVLFMNSGDDEDRALDCVKTLRARQVDGVLFTPVQEGDRDLEQLTHMDVPVVAAVRRPAGQDIDFVVADNELGGYYAAEHLLKLGHRRIGHIGGRIGAWTTEARSSGSARALAEYGLEVDERLVRRTPHDIEAGYRAAMELLEQPQRPTAIAAATLPQAMGVLGAAEALGLEIPGDLSVVAGDDADFAAFLRAPLTCVEQRAREIGRQGMELLLARLTGRRRRPKGIVLEPHLVVRASTAPPRGRGSRRKA